MIKKKLAIIFLLLLVCMPLLFSFYTIVSKILIAHAMVEKLETENLEKVTVDAASVVWLEEGKELLIGDEPFDVKQVLWHGDKITVWGLYDLQEKALKKTVAKYLREKDRTNSSRNAVLLLFFPFSCNTATVIVTCPFLLSIKQTWHYHDDDILCRCSDIITPPPRNSFLIS